MKGQTLGFHSQEVSRVKFIKTEGEIVGTGAGAGRVGSLFNGTVLVWESEEVLEMK